MLSTLSLFEKSRREVAPHEFLFRWKFAPRHSHKNWQGGRATRLPFSNEFRAMPQWKKLAGRSCHLVSILNRNPRVGGFRVRSRHNWATKGMPCAFWPHIWHPTWAKHEQNTRNMRETREKHASLSGFWLHSSSTPLPFFYEISALEFI